MGLALLRYKCRSSTPDPSVSLSIRFCYWFIYILSLSREEREDQARVGTAQYSIGTVEAPAHALQHSRTQTQVVLTATTDPGQRCSDANRRHVRCSMILSTLVYFAIDRGRRLHAAADQSSRSFLDAAKHDGHGDHQWCSANTPTALLSFMEFSLSHSPTVLSAFPDPFCSTAVRAHWYGILR
ncbi:hypothetical protein BD309DRAFT_699255 [Dichomitus squalens]|nr:hypothetical protein BD309DRAFT_699255 [Dichomitus squalens]